MKEKIPAFILMVATPISIVLFLKAVAFTGSEILGVLAAVVFYILVFVLLSLIFNRRAKESGDQKTSALDRFLEEKKTPAELAREEILKKQKALEKERVQK